MHRIAAPSMVAALLFFNVGVEIGQLNGGRKRSAQLGVALFPGD